VSHREEYLDVSTIAHARARTVRILVAGLAGTTLTLGLGATAAMAAPAAPVKVRAFAGGNSVALLWEAAAGTSPQSYSVYRGGAQIATNVPVANSAAPVRTVRFYDTAGLAAGSYQYQVRMTAVGGQVSGLSQTATVTRPATASPPIVNVANSDATLTAALTEVSNEVGRWYWKFVQVLAAPEYGMPSTVNIQVQTGLLDDGTIGANNTIIVRAGRVAAFATASDRTPLIGTVLHEMTHLIQQYPGGMPDWFIEGLAVYATHRIYHDADTPAPAATAYYTDGYGEASALVEYVVDHYGLPAVPHDLNIALHTNAYTEQFFVTRTGRTLNQLWTDLTGQTVNRIKFRSPAGWCLEPLHGGGAGTRLSIAGCWDTAYQAVAYRAASGAASGELAIKGVCLAIMDDGATVNYVACDGTAGQQWILRSNGNVAHAQTGRCLQPAGGVQSDHGLVEISPCTSGSPTQVWTRQLF
jgi:hypothetical protein